MEWVGSSLTDSDGEGAYGRAQHHVLHQVGAARPDQRRGLPLRPLVPGGCADAARAVVGGAAFSPPRGLLVRSWKEASGQPPGGFLEGGGRQHLLGHCIVYDALYRFWGWRNEIS